MRRDLVPAVTSLKENLSKLPELAHEVRGLENDFVDVIVRDITGYGYTMVVTISTNLLKVINDNSVNFIKPEVPLIIVKQLTQQFIEKVINHQMMVIG